MNARLSGRSMTLMLAGVAATILVSVVAIYLIAQPSEPSQDIVETQQAQPERSLPPSLDCAFHDFMRRNTVVSFYFDVVLSKGEAPRFYERAIVSADGKRTNFSGDERPAWSYALDDDGQSTITSPDGAEHIVLYGLKLGVSGISLLEAGIRSNRYRNLGGECRQTNIGG